MTRYVILGAGAIGGTIGGLLVHAGYDVLLIARGAHAAAMRADGLQLGRPEATYTLDVEVCEVDGLRLEAGDVLVVATKLQDSATPLTQIAALPGAADLPVICAQNGVHGERMALRRFSRVYGMCVMVPGSHLEPGKVLASGLPAAGAVDLGRYPKGLDDTATEAAEALRRSGFDCTAREEIMPWKYAKLLRNVGNAVQAICGEDRDGDGARELDRRARAEAEVVFAVAGIAWTPDEEWQAYRGMRLDIAPVEGWTRGGGSSWQSAARGLGSIESDYLNGEIAMLGRLHDVPTPVNTLLQREANGLIARGDAPGSITAAALLSRL